MSRNGIGRRLRASGIAGLASMLFGFLPATPQAVGGSFTECTDPPAVFNIDNLEPGMMGKGWTVIQGTDPVSFDVEILGILDDGIAPGIDMILAKASGDNVDKTGGVAYGFSGSPVYINGKLVGSISYKFWGDSYLAGITPGRPMVDILQYPSTFGKDTARALRRAPSRITIPDGLRARIADRLGVRTSEVSSTVEQLRLPVGVSGLTDEGLDKVQKRFDRNDMPFVVYRGGSAPKPRATADTPLVPGGSFGVINSYGDITYGAFGTVTAVCGDMVVGFGHIYDHLGETRQLGMNEAPVVTTVADEFFGDSYKIAVPGELHGVTDQDRWTGVRGIEGLIPRVMPVTTEVISLDTGKTMSGATYIVSKGGWIRWITSDHFYSALHMGLDAHNGTVDMTWTITGTFEGEPFTLTRTDQFAGYVLWQASYAPYQNLRIIQYSGFKPVKFTGIDATATVTQDVLRLNQRRPYSSSSLEPGMERRRRLDVAPGDTIHVMVPLSPSDGSALVRLEFDLAVPDNARGDGWIRIEDGDEPYRVKAKNFNQLINRLTNAEHNTDLVVRFKLGNMDKATRLVFPQDYVVGGENHQIRVQVVR